MRNAQKEEKKSREMEIERGKKRGVKGNGGETEKEKKRESE